MKRFSRNMVWIPALATFAIFVGCGPGNRQSVQRATDSKPYDLRSEGEIPPAPDLGKIAEADVEEEPVVEESLVVEEAEAPVDSTTPPAQPKMMPGFRVQIFAANAQDLAQRAASTAEERLGLRAYVDPVDDMFKVRVGDCLTREEAQQVLARCRETYYKDAWIVECPIRADRAGSSAAP